MTSLETLFAERSADAPTVDWTALRRARRSRRRRQVAGSAALLLALVGGAVVALHQPPGRQTLTVATTTDPHDLVGRWSVQGVGEDGDVLTFAGEATLDRPCGSSRVAWRADSFGDLLVDLDYGCGAIPPAWGASVAGYRTDGPDRLLLDPAGATVARLVPAGSATLGSPYVNPIAAPGALPAGLRAMSRDELLGVWVPPEGDLDQNHRFAQFRADGTYGAHDCNGVTGRWTVGLDGAFLSMGLTSTLVGCANGTPPEQVESAVRAATHGDDLVLVDPKGVQTRLVRQPPPAADSLVGTWTVEGAPEQGVVLDLHDGGFGLTSFCGNEAGRVLVSGADLVLAPQPSEQGCNPAWVRVAVSVRADGADRVLLDASGAQVARLVPTTSTRTIEFPMLAERALPDGLTAEARADLLGAWTLGDDVLRFTADGAWTSRSCSGYWNVGGAGLVVFGEVTGCLVPDPLVAARRVGTHDTELVLVASDGTQTVLTRA